MKKILMALSALTMVAAPAAAHPVQDYYGRYVQHSHQDSYGYQDRYYDQRRYEHRGRGYAYGRQYDRPVAVWRDRRDGRTYCRRSDGTVGIIVGGAAGAIVGREIDGGYNRSVGTILGGAVGALLGRQIARGEVRCR